MSDKKPTAGGSYTRDPETGSLTRTAHTARPDEKPEPTAKPARSSKKKEG